MSFWAINNIDLWLLAGVFFCIVWILIKAAQHDYEKHEERIRILEDNEELLFCKLRKIKR